MKIILYSFLLLCCFCTKKKPTEEPFICCAEPTSEKLVSSYWIAGKLNISSIASSIYLNIKPKYSYKDGDIHYLDGTVNTTQKDTFRLYSKLYHDSAYNEVPISMILADTIVNISVLSKFKLNTHNAGDTINDLVQIEYTSVYDYIQSRYTRGTKIVLNTSLTEFNAKQRLMVKADNIKLAISPFNPKPAKQQYEVRIRFTSGKIISDTTELMIN